LTYPTIAAAVEAGVPAVRLSNIFVKQFAGAEWLKKSRPAAPGFMRIPATAVPPDSYGLAKAAEQDQRFGLPPAGFVSMTNGPSVHDYQLVADRDLNGAGLVYFANYPVFLDIGERAALSLGAFALPSALVDRRTLVHRQSAYLNNASSRDTVRIEIEPWIENPWCTRPATADLEPVRLFVNARMLRQSDGRVMMIATAEKLLFGVPAEDLPFADRLRQLAETLPR